MCGWVRSERGNPKKADMISHLFFLPFKKNLSFLFYLKDNVKDNLPFKTTDFNTFFTR